MKKKKNKIQKTVSRLFILCVCIGLLASVCAVTLCAIVDLTTDENIMSADEVSDTYDCIMILGAKVFDDGTPCDMLADRLETGAALYFSGVSDKIIVSGDHGRESYDEVNAMKAYLVNKGIPENVIFTDHAGFSTYDSVYRCFSIFGAESVAIVSQDFHLPRAVFIAESYGLEAVGVSADLHTYAGVAYNYIREIPAKCKDFIKLTFSMKSKLGGESISLDGDASASDG